MCRGCAQCAAESPFPVPASHGDCSAGLLQLCSANIILREIPITPRWPEAVLRGQLHGWGEPCQDLLCQADSAAPSSGLGEAVSEDMLQDGIHTLPFLSHVGF